MLLALLPTQGLLYLFQVTEQRLTKNLLQGALTTEECQEVFGRSCAEFAEEDGAVRVALATLAMGDNAAVEFAQGAHHGVLYRHGVGSGKLYPETIDGLRFRVWRFRFKFKFRMLEGSGLGFRV